MLARLVICALAAAPAVTALNVPTRFLQSRHTKLAPARFSAPVDARLHDDVLRLSGGAVTKTVLVTGGVGYIGSHTVLELLSAGYEVVIVDNLCNSNLKCLRRVEKLAGRTATFYNIDIRDKEAMAGVFTAHKIDSVIHFAGLKAVGESVALPLLYYQVPFGAL